MNAEDYVLDEKRGKAWNTAREAMEWYRSELARVEAERDELRWMYDELCK